MLGRQAGAKDTKLIHELALGKGPWISLRLLQGIRISEWLRNFCSNVRCPANNLIRNVWVPIKNLVLERSSTILFAWLLDLSRKSQRTKQERIRLVPTWRLWLEYEARVITKDKKETGGFLLRIYWNVPKWYNLDLSSVIQYFKNW